MILVVGKNNPDHKTAAGRQFCASPPGTGFGFAELLVFFKAFQAFLSNVFADLINEVRHKLMSVKMISS